MTDEELSISDATLIALLRDVPICGRIYTGGNCLNKLVCKKDVLAALSAHLDADLAERAGEVLGDLRKGPEYVYRFVDTDYRAADLITALLTANAALRAERDSLLTTWAESRERHLAAEAEVEKLRGALVEHNDLLRSTFQIAEREGVKRMIASTNWDAFYNRVAVVLKRHYQTANEARAALTTEADNG